jgi:hypothetical protein
LLSADYGYRTFHGVNTKGRYLRAATLAARLHYSQQSDLAASLSGLPADKIAALLSITRIKRYILDQSIEH